MSRKKTSQAATLVRVRNKEIRKVRVADLEDAPWNFRTHPKEQADALDGAIEEIGFYSYPDVYITAEGKLRLCDGHLRKERLLANHGPNVEIEVNVTDFTEAEAKMATLTKDPLAALAGQSETAMKALMEQVETGNDALQKMFDDMAANGSGVPVNTPKKKQRRFFIPPEIELAVAAYCQRQEVPPDEDSVIVFALRKFFTQTGDMKPA